MMRMVLAGLVLVFSRYLLIGKVFVDVKYGTNFVGENRIDS